MTTAQKSQLRKDINSLMLHYNDLIDACTNQHPQPNGNVYLHGEAVRRSTLAKTVNELNELIISYNYVCKHKIELIVLKFSSIINRHTNKSF